MNDAVDTIFGRVSREDLDVSEHIVEDARNRTVRTEWRLRRDLEPLLEFVYPPMQAADGSAIEGTERTVQSTKGELVRADSHVMAKRGIELLPEQGFLNQ